MRALAPQLLVLCILVSLSVGCGFRPPSARAVLPHGKSISNSATARQLSRDLQMSESSGIEKKALKHFASLMMGVGATGGGQTHNGRAELHEAGAKRRLADPQMWTHLFFVMAGLMAFQNGIWDLLLLLTVVTPLSILYHHTYEKPGRLAQAEGVSAKILFIYGTLQILAAPTPALKYAELTFFLATVSIFVYTNLRNDLYDPWHCLMHVVPSAWSAVVAATHTPLAVNPISVLRAILGV